jgi:site-specific recombinase XerD
MTHTDEWIAHLRAERDLSEQTIAVYSGAVRRFEEFSGIINSGLVTTRDLDKFLNRLYLLKRSDSSRRSHIYGLQSFFKFCFSRGLISADPARFLRTPRRKFQAISTFTKAEIEKLIFEIDPPALVKGRRENDVMYMRRKKIRLARHVRDDACLAVIYSAFLRVGEVARLKVSDVVVDRKGMASIRVSEEAKWASEPQLQPIDEETFQRLKIWLALREALEIPGSALFPPLTRRRMVRGDDQEIGLSTTHLALILKERIAAAGIRANGRRLTCHTIRYSRASHFYEVYPDIVKLSRLLRHRSIQTTIGYIRRSSSSATAGQARNSVPWSRTRRLIENFVTPSDEESILALDPRPGLDRPKS